MRSKGLWESLLNSQNNNWNIWRNKVNAFNIFRLSLSTGLFTWRWGTPGRWGNPLRWGNPPVHIISHFNLIKFTWWVGWSAKVGSPDRVTLSAGVKFCHVNVSRSGNPPSRGRIRDTSNSRKIHFGGSFVSLLKVRIESHSPEGYIKSSKWV